MCSTANICLGVAAGNEHWGVLFSLAHPRPCKCVAGGDWLCPRTWSWLGSCLPPPPPRAASRDPGPLATHRCHEVTSLRGLLTNTAAWWGLYVHCFPDVCHAGDNNHGRLHIGKLRINSRVLFFSCKSLVKARNILNKVIMIIHIMFNCSLFFAIYATEHIYTLLLLLLQCPDTQVYEGIICLDINHTFVFSLSINWPPDH